MRQIRVSGLILLAVLIALFTIEFAMSPVTLADSWAGALINYQGPRHPPTSVRVYKETPTRPLRMHIFESAPSESPEPSVPGATVMLIHGGGFHSGWPEEFFPLATALARVGHTVFVPEYRLQRADGVAYPRELEDCRDALAWVEREAATFGGDPARLILGGSSAGAHLAAGLETFPSELARPGRRPLGLLLTSPYLDSAERSARFERERSRGGPLARLFTPPSSDVFEGRSRELSPRAHLHKEMPPALILAGEEDPLWPPGNEFCEAMRKLGAECESRAFRGAGHAFSLKGQTHHDAVIEEIEAALRRWLAAS